MCEMRSAFSAAFVDLTPGVDASRLTTRDRDFVEQARLFSRDRCGMPAKADEQEASEILGGVDGALAKRFGLDPVVSRYILCAVATTSGKPIAALARAVARAARP